MMLTVLLTFAFIVFTPALAFAADAAPSVVMTSGQVQMLVVAPLLAAVAAFVRRFTPTGHWAHESWFPWVAAGASAILSALADLARGGGLTRFSALMALTGAVTALLASWKPGPPPADPSLNLPVAK